MNQLVGWTEAHEFDTHLLKRHVINVCDPFDCGRVHSTSYDINDINLINSKIINCHQLA